ncbi:MAG: DUF4389 domain-containing protein [Alphaproteobacteria bacterium]
MDNEVTEHPSRWTRLIPMLVLILCFGLSEAALYIIALIQFIWVLVNGEPNEGLTEFGASLAEWMSQNAKYLSYATEEKPYPWAEWPSQD